MIQIEKLTLKQSEYQHLAQKWDAVVVASSNSIMGISSEINIQTDFWVTPGAKTKSYLTKNGIDKPIYSAPNSNAIAQLILKTEAQKILWLGSQTGNQEGVNLLLQKKRDVTHIGTYKTKRLPIPSKLISSLDSKIARIWIVPSPSCFRAEIPINDAIVCLGKTTSNFLKTQGRFPYFVASQPSMKTLALELDGKINPYLKFDKINYEK